MSDYLTRAVESIRPESAAIRPRLPTVFEPEAATPAPTASPFPDRREVENGEQPETASPLRERIATVVQSVTSQPRKPDALPLVRPTTSDPAPAERPTEKLTAPPIAKDDAPRAPATAKPATTPSRITILPQIARPVASEPRSEAPPAIHITIGRIEVRATAPAAAPTPKPRPQNAPRISLDDYLRKRSGGGA